MILEHEDRVAALFQFLIGRLRTLEVREIIEDIAAVSIPHR